MVESVDQRLIHLINSTLTIAQFPCSKCDAGDRIPCGIASEKVPSSSDVTIAGMGTLDDKLLTRVQADRVPRHISAQYK